MCGCQLFSWFLIWSFALSSTHGRCYCNGCCNHVSSGAVHPWFTDHQAASAMVTTLTMGSFSESKKYKEKKKKGIKPLYLSLLCLAPAHFCPTKIQEIGPWIGFNQNFLFCIPSTNCRSPSDLPEIRASKSHPLHLKSKHRGDKASVSCPCVPRLAN